MIMLFLENPNQFHVTDMLRCQITCLLFHILLLNHLIFNPTITVFLKSLPLQHVAFSVWPLGLD